MKDSSIDNMTQELKLAIEAERYKIRKLVLMIQITKVYYRSGEDGFVPKWIRSQGIEHGSIKNGNIKEPKRELINVAPERVYWRISKNEVKVRDFSCQFPEPEDEMYGVWTMKNKQHD